MANCRGVRTTSNPVLAAQPARLSHSCDLSEIRGKVPAPIRIPVHESPTTERITQFWLFFSRADGRPCVTSGLRVEQQKPPLVSVTNSDTILTTDYSSTGGRKSGKEGAQTSATAADAPSRDPTSNQPRTSLEPTPASNQL